MSRFIGTSWFCKGLRAAAIVAVLCGSGPAANAACVYCVSEIYLNPPGSNDESNDLEYVEVFGPASTSWSNKYLVFLENENSGSNGQVESFFNLTSITSGANGYIVFTMDDHPYPSIDPDAIEIQADQSEGFRSSYFTRSGSDYSIENSGFTALLIDKGAGSAPTINLDLDAGNDGDLDLPAGWTIQDRVGVIGENDELDSKLFGGDVNFGPGVLTGSTDGTYRNVDAVTSTFDEIEYVARHAADTGYTGDDWYAGNLTDGDSDYDDSLRNYSIGGDSMHVEFVNIGGGTSSYAFEDDVTVTLGTTNIAPEPGSLVLLFLGVIGLSTTSRRTRG